MYFCHRMKLFKMVLVLFIGMISLTSFGKTADDTTTKNDTIVFDVGDALTETIVGTVSTCVDVLNDNFVIETNYKTVGSTIPGTDVEHLYIVNDVGRTKGINFIVLKTFDTDIQNVPKTNKQDCYKKYDIRFAKVIKAIPVEPNLVETNKHTTSTCRNARDGLMYR